jgi:chromosome segregation ATPase
MTEQMRARDALVENTRSSSDQAAARVAELQGKMDVLQAQVESERQAAQYKAGQHDLELEAAMAEVEQAQLRAEQAEKTLARAEADRDTARAELQRVQLTARTAEAELARVRAASDAAAAQAATLAQRVKEADAAAAATKQKMDDLALENSDLHEFVITLEAEKEETVVDANKAATQLKLKAQQLEGVESSLKAAIGTAPAALSGARV